MDGADLIQITSLRPQTVFRLPFDLLSEIISTYKELIEDDECQRRKEDYFIHGTYEWINITHVCHDWRVVALSNPSLWTSICIPKVPTDFVDELLRRSGSLPIMLSFLSNRTISPADISRFLCHNGIKRPIRRLQLSCDGKLHLLSSSFLPSLLDGMEEFTITDCTHDACATWLSFIQPRTFRLKHLAIKSFECEPSLLHDSLITLKLECSAWGASIPWDEFLQAFAPLKNLEHLQLQFFFDQYGSNRAPGDRTSQRISFPRLQVLILHGDSAMTYTDLLRSISFPHTARISISSSHSALDSFGSLLEMLSPIISQNPASQLNSLGLKVFDQKRWVDAIEYSIQISLDRGISASNDAQYSILCNIYESEGDEEPKTWSEHLLTFLQSCPIGGTRFVELCNETEDIDYSGPIIQWIANLPSLRTLHIEKMRLDQLVSQAPNCVVSTCPRYSIRLSYTSVEPVTSALRSLLCETCRSFLESYFPPLQKLRYANTTLRGADGRLDNEQVQLMREFLSTLWLGRQRKLQKLELEYADVDDEEVKLLTSGLKSFCDEIVWVE